MYYDFQLFLTIVSCCVSAKLQADTILCNMSWVMADLVLHFFIFLQQFYIIINNYYLTCPEVYKTFKNTTSRA